MSKHIVKSTRTCGDINDVHIVIFRPSRECNDHFGVACAINDVALAINHANVESKTLRERCNLNGHIRSESNFFMTCAQIIEGSRCDNLGLMKHNDVISKSFSLIKFVRCNNYTTATISKLLDDATDEVSAMNIYS